VEQDALLSKFNGLKELFVKASPSDLNFPKLHSLQHVSESTRRFGTPDNADTEITEHQHRTDVKVPYQRTNKRDPLPQVVKFVERRSAFEDKLEHISTNNPPADTTTNTPMTENFRHMSGIIPEGVIHINDASKLLKVSDLELATQTFLHDLEFTGEGYRHRVNRRNLPRLSDPMVSSSACFTQSTNKNAE
jgi:hypothetical protein